MTHWLSLLVKNIYPVFTWFRIDIKTSGSTADLCLHKGSFDAFTVTLLPRAHFILYWTPFYSYKCACCSDIQCGTVDFTETVFLLFLQLFLHSCINYSSSERLAASWRNLGSMSALDRRVVNTPSAPGAIGPYRWDVGAQGQSDVWSGPGLTVQWTHRENQS